MGSCSDPQRSRRRLLIGPCCRALTGPGSRWIGPLALQRLTLTRRRAECGARVARGVHHRHDLHDHRRGDRLRQPVRGHRRDHQTRGPHLDAVVRGPPSRAVASAVLRSGFYPVGCALLAATLRVARSAQGSARVVRPAGAAEFDRAGTSVGRPAVLPGRAVQSLRDALRGVPLGLRYVLRRVLDGLQHVPRDVLRAPRDAAPDALLLQELERRPTVHRSSSRRRIQTGQVFSNASDRSLWRLSCGNPGEWLQRRKTSQRTASPHALTTARARSIGDCTETRAR